jgi:hypothetical protein
MAKKVTIAAKPSATKTRMTADEWVAGAKPTGETATPEEKKQEEATTRYTIDIPKSLHARIKSQCALKGVKMRDEIIELLLKHFRG